MSHNMTDTKTDDTQRVSILQQEVQLLEQKQRIELAFSPQGQQLELLRAKRDADFALTPVGQELKRFETNQRMGQMYAQSTIVPDTYKGNIANCAIACDVALRMNANALMVMQNLYLVHGMPSWSTKFLIATINTCGRFQPLRYECNDRPGDEYGYRCYTYSADDKKKSERLEGPWVTWAMVKAEGWDRKTGSKWRTMPEQMFRYRAAAFWQRLYAPEISMGFNTVDESEDMMAQDTAQDVAYTEVTPDGEQTHTSGPKPTIAELARQRARQAAAAAAPVAAAPDTDSAADTPSVIDTDTAAEAAPAADTDAPAAADEQQGTLFVDEDTGEIVDPSRFAR